MDNLKAWCAAIVTGDMSMAFLSELAASGDPSATSMALAAFHALRARWRSGRPISRPLRGLRRPCWDKSDHEMIGADWKAARLGAACNG
jgi:hypothetical protein